MDSFEATNIEAPSADELRATRFLVGGDEYAVFSFVVEEVEAPASLTEGEKSVFHAVLNGQSNQEIAASRRRSLRTIANQVAAIFRKLGVGSRGELIARHAVRSRARRLT